MEIRVVIKREKKVSNILVHVEGVFEGTSVLTLPLGSALHDVLPHIRFDDAVAASESIFLKRRSVAENQKKALEDALYHLEKNAVLGLSGSEGEAKIRAQRGSAYSKFR